MGFVLIYGSVLPGGTDPGWDTSRSYSDFVQNDGWLVEGPYSEIVVWEPAATAAISGEGECSPDFLIVTAPGAEWSAMVDAYDNGTDAELRTAVTALLAARAALYP